MAELEPLQEYSRNQLGGCRQVQKKRTIALKRVKKEPVHFIWDCHSQCRQSSPYGWGKWGRWEWELVSNTPAFQRAAQETRLFNRTGTTNRTHIVWIHEGCWSQGREWAACWGTRWLPWGKGQHSLMRSGEGTKFIIKVKDWSQHLAIWIPEELRRGLVSICLACFWEQMGNQYSLNTWEPLRGKSCSDTSKPSVLQKNTRGSKITSPPKRNRTP